MTPRNSLGSAPIPSLGGIKNPRILFLPVITCALRPSHHWEESKTPEFYSSQEYLAFCAHPITGRNQKPPNFIPPRNTLRSAPIPSLGGIKNPRILFLPGIACALRPSHRWEESKTPEFYSSQEYLGLCAHPITGRNQKPPNFIPPRNTLRSAPIPSLGGIENPRILFLPGIPCALRPSHHWEESKTPEFYSSQ
jgi:hypothetical protein